MRSFWTNILWHLLSNDLSLGCLPHGSPYRPDITSEIYENEPILAAEITL